MQISLLEISQVKIEKRLHEKKNREEGVWGILFFS
jgi:hypothetical protein